MMISIYSQDRIIYQEAEKIGIKIRMKTEIAY